MSLTLAGGWALAVAAGPRAIPPRAAFPPMPPGATTPAGAPDSAVQAVEGLRAELLDSETMLSDGRYSWTVLWRLCWFAVPDVLAYQVTAVSFEGAGPLVRTEEPCYQLTVAQGVSARPGDRAGMSEQLELMASSLSVRVVAEFARGATGPPTDDLPVGEIFP